MLLLVHYNMVHLFAQQNDALQGNKPLIEQEADGTTGAEVSLSLYDDPDT
jgi:hypothetical protein